MLVRSSVAPTSSRITLAVSTLSRDPPPRSMERGGGGGGPACDVSSWALVALAPSRTTRNACQPHCGTILRTEQKDSETMAKKERKES